MTMLNFVQRYDTDSYTKLKGSGGGVGKNWEGPRETPTMDNFKALSSIHYHQRILNTHFLVCYINQLFKLGNSPQLFYICFLLDVCYLQISFLILAMFLPSVVLLSHMDSSANKLTTGLLLVQRCSLNFTNLLHNSMLLAWGIPMGCWRNIKTNPDPRLI